MQPRVGIVLVNYNGLKFMPECLETLTKIDYPEYRIVVVDNASTDGSAEWLAQNYPELTLLKLCSNKGITGGNNAGINWCLENDCEYVLFLNNDTAVEPDFLNHLVASAGPLTLTTPKIYFYDDKTLINSHVGSFNYKRGVMVELFYRRRDTEASRQVQPVKMANTCALLVHRGIVKEIGGMDDAYFMYYDDTDYITRINKTGATILFVPNAVIYHKESSSSGGVRSPLSIYYCNRNRLYFMAKHQTNPLLLFAFYIYYCLNKIVWSLLELLRGERHTIRAMLRGVEDYLKGKTGYASPERFS